jgi:hypothetical protein
MDRDDFNSSIINEDSPEPRAPRRTIYTLLVLAILIGWAIGIWSAGAATEKSIERAKEKAEKDGYAAGKLEMEKRAWGLGLLKLVEAEPGVPIVYELRTPEEIYRVIEDQLNNAPPPPAQPAKPR